MFYTRYLFPSQMRGNSVGIFEQSCSFLKRMQNKSLKDEGDGRFGFSCKLNIIKEVSKPEMFRVGAILDRPKDGPEVN